MKLVPISAGNFHCDGGALFGVIPKKLWSKVYPADENNFTKKEQMMLDYIKKRKEILHFVNKLAFQ